MEITFSLRLPREAASVPLVRAIVRDSLQHLQVEAMCISDVALAVTEACANVVLHAEGNELDYEVVIQVIDDRLHVRVVDRGTGDGGGLDADAPMPPAGDDHGRGIALMRMLVDRLSFVSEPEVGTVVHLEKHLELEPGSPLLLLNSA